MDLPLGEPIELSAANGRQRRFPISKRGIPQAQLRQPAQPQAELIFRILPRTSTSRTAHLFGLAFATADGFGQYATIFYSEVRARAKGEEAFEGRILGYAIAHEVGHLLLKNQRHASVGIMTSGWTAKDLRLTVKQFFLFTRSEAEQLRTNLKARILATEAPSAE